MENQDRQTFKKLFSQYCEEEIAKSHCDDGACSCCPINRAYIEIFPDETDTIDTLMDFLEDALSDSVPDWEVSNRDDQKIIVKSAKRGVSYCISVEEYDNAEKSEVGEKTEAASELLESIQSELEEHRYNILAVHNNSLVCKDGNKPEFLVIITEVNS